MLQPIWDDKHQMIIFANIYLTDKYINLKIFQLCSNYKAVQE